MKSSLKKICIALFTMLFIPVFSGCNTEKSIISILKTSTNGNVDTYTITYSDKTTTTMEVNNGQKTIVNFEKTSTLNGVDTYTITYSDNTTSTFEVTNGKNGQDGINGKDGAVITVTDLYNQWQSELGEEDDKSFDNFLRTYLTISGSNPTINGIATAMNSVVSINTVFNYTYSHIFGSTSKQSVSAGSGVIVNMSESDKNNGNCYIMTNYHVVYDSTSNDPNGISQDIRVFLYGMEDSSTNVISAKYIGGSMAHDIAILKVTNSDALKRSNAVQCKVSESKVVVGQDIIAIGNPEGEGISVTKGICSVENEQIEMTLSDNLTEGTFNVIRIDAAVNPGNSGGGLFNTEGQLVGIVNAKLIDSKIDCIGYAIPIKTAIAVYERILETCNGDDKLTPKFAKLGLSCSSYGYETYYDVETFSVQARSRIVIREIATDGVSATLGANGFKLKDVIVSANYKGKIYTFNSMYDLYHFLLIVKVDESVTFNVNRVVITDSIDVSNDTLYYDEAEYIQAQVSVTFSEQYFK